MAATPELYPPRDTAAYRRILAAAEASFGTLGFQKTTVVEIAAAAQVSKPLVYRYFESKEHLYEVVTSRLMQSWNEELVGALALARQPGEGAPQGNVSEALRRMHRVSLEYARRSPLLRGLLANEGRLLLASYGDLIERTIGTLRNQIAQCLQQGIDTGQVRLDLPLDAMADAVTEIHLAYAERVVSGTERPNAQQLSLDAFECLLFGICVKEENTPTMNRRKKRSR
ncbi:MAG: TetR/AcrR family transcriptional regulator [Myxococcota bacterium]